MTFDLPSRLCPVGVVLLLVLPARAEDPQKTLDNWKDLRAAFVRCWTVPKGTEGSVIAFRFLFAPNGGLRGPPMVMARILKGDDREEALRGRGLLDPRPLPADQGDAGLQGGDGRVAAAPASGEHAA